MFLDCLNDQYFRFFLFSYQYLKAKKAATPPLIQRSSSCVVGSSIYITKLVLCPVVDKVPDLLTTLYSGQLYIFSTYLRSSQGNKCITGN